MDKVAWQEGALYIGRPVATLEMFPSWPMRFHHTIRGSSKSGEESTDSRSAVHTLSSRGEGSRLEPESPVGRNTDSSSDHRVIDQMRHLQLPQQIDMASRSDSPRTGMSQAQLVAKPTSEKVFTLINFLLKSNI
ncbi:transcription factor TGA2 [Forsythia ovata]|uniref:Transcription factor TGA2 n=1 Tax=Forsythia ovata TaxID=205694 RepID=A0ABD1W8E0_9LAMI